MPSIKSIYLRLRMVLEDVGIRCGENWGSVQRSCHYIEVIREFRGQQYLDDLVDVSVLLLETLDAAMREFNN